MNRFQKLCLVLLIVVTLIPLLFLLLVTRPASQQYSFLNRLQFSLVSHEIFLLTIFWIAAVLTVILLLAVLWVIFYPKAKRDFVIKEQNGRLAVKDRAIKGLVAATVSEKDFVSQPMISVAATKRKIKVLIKGDLKRTSGLVGRTAEWTEEIRQQIRQTVGTDYDIQVEVAYKNLEKDSKPYATARVE